MGTGVTTWLSKKISHWLTRDPDHPSESVLLLNFDRMSYEIRPGDVILVEGRSKVSDVIKLITQSSWTHAALYIGRPFEIEDEALRQAITDVVEVEPHQQLIIETLLGEGTVVNPLEKYRHEHLRICRPSGLSPIDAQQVIGYTIKRLGTGYDVRQLLDLARFMFPYGILPRRWRSSLFTHNAGDPTRTVCSTMLAQAFQSVQFPLLPLAEKTEHNKIHLYQRNPRLYTPKDFDYSPYFNIIKYPLFGLNDLSIYRQLPWVDVDIVCNDIDDCFKEAPHQVAMATTPEDNGIRRRSRTLNLMRANHTAEQGEHHES
ncbi:MAG: hypothetical protein LJE74_08080 [Proteobacteria bacterium]|jgi:hypothetical protein|nr:hypothetical protein [Pseudomonadota bacterium]MCG6934967.1 hypothetical protein [Pseudomonadota bacterium]